MDQPQGKMPKHMMYSSTPRRPGPPAPNSMPLFRPRNAGHQMQQIHGNGNPMGAPPPRPYNSTFQYMPRHHNGSSFIDDRRRLSNARPFYPQEGNIKPEYPAPMYYYNLAYQEQQQYYGNFQPSQILTGPGMQQNLVEGELMDSRTPQDVSPPERSHSQGNFMDGPGNGSTRFRRRSGPTQIPIHALQFADITNAWHQERKDCLPPALPQQDFVQSAFAEINGTFQPPHYNGHQEQQNMQYFGMNQTAQFPFDLKLMDCAHQGFAQFRQDYCKQPSPPPAEPPQENPSNPRQANLRSEIDEVLLSDQRPIQNFIEPGQREFKMFDDYNKAEADQIKSIYNVNMMDYCNAKEICGKRLLPQSIQRWPVDAIRSDLGELRKQALTVPGRPFQNAVLSIFDSGFEFDSTCFKESGDCKSDAGAFGLMSLARCLHGEGAEKNKLGYLTFVGMNLHKLYRDVDRTDPLCTSFPGPLADRNHQLNNCLTEMHNGFSEYELENGSWIDRLQFKNRIRMRRMLMDSFNFDTLIFIFYTFHGDALQILAAQRLYGKGWRFHKLFQVWIAPMETDKKGGDIWAPGIYTYFDYSRWDVSHVELKHVNDSVLEGKPMDFTEALWD